MGAHKQNGVQWLHDANAQVARQAYLQQMPSPSQLSDLSNISLLDQLTRPGAMGQLQNALSSQYNSAPSPPMPAADRLNNWYSSLQRRVKQIEDDDSMMGKTESDQWGRELEEFRNEFPA